MKTGLLRRGFALLLAVLLLSALGTTALAASYEAGQYYEYDKSNTAVSAVQVSASTSLRDAEKRRDQMLEAGFDAFVYLRDETYRVMCGKFRDTDEAMKYQNRIQLETDRKNAYTTKAYLPESAIADFEAIYYNGDETPEDLPRTEQPTGLYFDGDALTGDTVRAFTVQFSAGTSFHGAEKHRDEMIERGYADSFVYKLDNRYRSMTGMFESRAEADARRSAILDVEPDAYVTSVELPVSAVSWAGGEAPAAPAEPAEPDEPAAPAGPEAPVTEAPAAPAAEEAGGETAKTEKNEDKDKDHSTLFLILLIVVCAAIPVVVLLLVLLLRKKPQAAAAPAPAAPHPPTRWDYDDIVEQTAKQNQPAAAAAPAPAKPGGGLRLLNGPLQGAVLPMTVGAALQIGKDSRSCSVVVDANFTHVSRVHCSVVYTGPGRIYQRGADGLLRDETRGFYAVTDLSTNGTFLADGRRLEKGVPVNLPSGTVLYLGGRQFAVELK